MRTMTKTYIVQAAWRDSDGSLPWYLVGDERRMLTLAEAVAKAAEVRAMKLYDEVRVVDMATGKRVKAA